MKTNKEIPVVKKLSIKNMRGVYDYKIFTKDLKDDLLEALNIMVSTHGTLAYMESVKTRNKFFVINRDSMSFIESFYGENRDDSYLSDKKVLIYINNSNFTVNYYSGDNLLRSEMYTKLRLFVNKFFFDNRFDNCQTRKDIISYPYRDFSFYLRRTVNETMSRKIKSVIPYFHHNDFTMPDEYHHFNFFIDSSDNDKVKFKFTYRGRETIMKVGKGLRRMFRVLKIEVTDEEVKRVVNRLVVDLSEYEMRVVSGHKDIDKYYLESSYDIDSFELGSLGGSCMKYEGCVNDNYFEIYHDNAKLLILVHKETDLILGRALLWDNAVDTKNDNISYKIMDRIYAIEKNYNAFFDWAIKNGYYRKRYQSYDNETDFVNPETRQTEALYMKLDINLDEYSRLPYMDTFAWSDGCTTRNEEEFGHLWARDTDGELGGRGEEFDEW